MTDSAMKELTAERGFKLQMELAQAVGGLQALVDTIAAGGYLEQISPALDSGNRLAALFSVCEAQTKRACELSDRCERPSAHGRPKLDLELSLDQSELAQVLGGLYAMFDAMTTTGCLESITEDYKEGSHLIALIGTCEGQAKRAFELSRLCADSGAQASAGFCEATATALA